MSKWTALRMAAGITLTRTHICSHAAKQASLFSARTCARARDKPALNRQLVEERGQLQRLDRARVVSHFHCRSIAYVWPRRSSASHGGKHEQSLVFTTESLHFRWPSDLTDDDISRDVRVPAPTPAPLYIQCSRFS